jgi:hypothetical protein
VVHAKSRPDPQKKSLNRTAVDLFRRRRPTYVGVDPSQRLKNADHLDPDEA